ncbi:cilia- and flagella-associated protein 161-like [Actinia tenebrosa]|uniref:Cilia- and flagella-associated protein 161-like n=1 Tax=Actinia tenebrosa TaxID=6105 RepID=A0A6P8IDR7_ACTTE|nr:cilia- and flagella-associated protein 161-like [Actinia tenebrosa]
MSVRTYNHSVLIGNWNEDICLEEDKLKDFLDKKERGELLIQKASNLLGNILKKVDLSISHDGFLHFGDVVCLYNPAHQVLLSANMSEAKMQDAKCLSGPCELSASKSLQPCVRNTFIILSPDANQEGQVLRYGQPFILSTLPGVGGELKVHSDRVSFNRAAKKSRKQEVNLTENTSFTAHWNFLCFNPQERLESDGMPVPANQRILVNHCKTNQHLACMPEFSSRTPFGREFEVASHTFFDSHRAEKPVNHWVVLTRMVEDAAEQYEVEKEQMMKPSQNLETFDEPPQGGATYATQPDNPAQTNGS